SSCVRILCSVCQWMSYSWHAWRLLISPVRTRRRISAHASMSVYTPASCRTASDHGRDRYRTVGTALERYTFGSANRTSASAALLGRRLQIRLGCQSLGWLGFSSQSHYECSGTSIPLHRTQVWDRRSARASHTTPERRRPMSSPAHLERLGW